MAQVVLLRGVNVGGNRTFRPSVLVKQLTDYDVVNIGAAGTFVVRDKVSQQTLRRDVLGKLPFETLAIICEGKDFLNLAANDPFAGEPPRPDIVRFVSVLSEKRAAGPSIPIHLPTEAEWLLKIVSCKGRFLFGMYKRQMKAIRYLSQIDKLFGSPATTRNWNTITTIVKTLEKAN
jgi:uncharacterized protein (DUF1697 family)